MQIATILRQGRPFSRSHPPIPYSYSPDECEKFSVEHSDVIRGRVLCQGVIMCSVEGFCMSAKPYLSSTHTTQLDRALLLVSYLIIAVCNKRDRSGLNNYTVYAQFRSCLPICRAPEDQHQQGWMSYIGKAIGTTASYLVSDFQLELTSCMYIILLQGSDALSMNRAFAHMKLPKPGE